MGQDDTRMTEPEDSSLLRPHSQHCYNASLTGLSVHTGLLGAQVSPTFC